MHFSHMTTYTFSYTWAYLSGHFRSLISKLTKNIMFLSNNILTYRNIVNSVHGVRFRNKVWMFVVNIGDMYNTCKVGVYGWIGGIRPVRTKENTLIFRSISTTLYIMTGGHVQLVLPTHQET